MNTSLSHEIELFKNLVSPIYPTAKFKAHHFGGHLLHQEKELEVVPWRSRGARSSSIVCFSFGVNGTPLTRFKAIICTFVFCLCLL